MSPMLLALAIEISTSPAAIGVPSLVQAPPPPNAMAVFGNVDPTAAVATEPRSYSAHPRPRAGTRISARAQSGDTVRVSLDPRNALEERQDDYDRR